MLASYGKERDQGSSLTRILLMEDDNMKACRRRLGIGDCPSAILNETNDM